MSFFEIGASLLGGLLGSDSASDAADAQAGATAASIAEQRRQFDLTRSDYAPYRSIGGNALRRLAALYGIEGGGAGTGSASGMTEAQIRQMLTPQYTTPGSPATSRTVNPEYDEYVPATPASVDQAGLDLAIADRMGQQQGQTGGQTVFNDGLDDPIQMDPGYEFGRQQGEQALNRRIAASGGRVSGASLKAAQRFGTDYATTGYSAAYGRRQDRENRLATLAGIGQTSTNASAQAGQSATNAITNAMQSQGDASGAARLAQGSIWGNAVNQAGAAYQRMNQPTGTGYWPTNMGQSWSYDK